MPFGIRNQLSADLVRMAVAKHIFVRMSPDYKVGRRSIIIEGVVLISRLSMAVIMLSSRVGLSGNMIVVSGLPMPLN